MNDLESTGKQISEKLNYISKVGEDAHNNIN